MTSHKNDGPKLPVQQLAILGKSLALLDLYMSFTGLE